jgi:hypothetical protein
LRLWRGENDLHLAAVAGEELAKLKRDQGDYAAAESELANSLTLRREVGDRHGVASCLQGLATIASAAGRWEDAAHLFGTASEARQALGLPLLPADPDRRADVERHWNAARTGLGDEVFNRAYALGQSMPFDRVLADLLKAQS